MPSLPEPCSRREFLQTSARTVTLGTVALGTAAASFGLGLTSCGSTDERLEAEPEPAPRPLRLLILGGTGFLGPHTVERALARGHDMTLFNRGKTNPHLFPDLEKLEGDRDGDLAALEGRDWDAVIDTSGYVPRHARDSATLLADHVQQYVFISTISVYRDFPAEDIDESSPVGTLEDPTVEEVTGMTYGPLKALCEQEIERALPGRATIIRPGLIVGPGDRSDRYTYWPVRVSQGGEVLAPGDPSHEVQMIDVRDLAAWIIHTIEQRVVGTYNADGPPLRLDAMLNACREASDSDATFTWVPTDFLTEQQVRPWSDLPTWIPPGEGRDQTSRAANARAVNAGLTFRTPLETAIATLTWHRTTRDADYELRAGLSRERESEVLAAWHASESKAAGERRGG